MHTKMITIVIKPCIASSCIAGNYYHNQGFHIISYFYGKGCRRSYLLGLQNLTYSHYMIVGVKYYVYQVYKSYYKQGLGNLHFLRPCVDSIKNLPAMERIFYYSITISLMFYYCQLNLET